MNNSRLKTLFKRENLDLVISTSEQTRLWFTEFQASFGILLIEPKDSFLFVDGRYFEAAKAKVQNAEVRLFTSFTNLEKDFLDKSKNKYLRIGIESNYLTINELNNFKNLFPNSEFVEFNAQELRIIKSETEIKKMKKACQIALISLQELEKELKPGVTEKYLDAKLNYLLRKNGAEKNSFDAIVVSGKNGSLPHGKPSDKKLSENELVTIDFGAYYEGFASDITRTFQIGKIKDQRILEIEQILREAQKLGVEGVRPGVTTGQIDKICRDHITKHGYGEYFIHSTGHGLGIDVHELPNVTQNKMFDVTLEPGMVITVEPGIYIPNFGGIRVEDDILVTETGYEILSKLD